MASLLVFGTVISDAAMVDRVIGMDVQEAAAARDRVPRRDRGMGERPRRREIEGLGAGSGTSLASEVRFEGMRVARVGASGCSCTRGWR